MKITKSTITDAKEKLKRSEMPQFTISKMLMQLLTLHSILLWIPTSGNAQIWAQKQDPNNKGK